MSDLDGKTLLNKSFIQDPNLKNWMKIDNIVIGETPSYGYLSGNSNDIQTLLKNLFADQRVSVCLYNWQTGAYYTKIGYNLGNTSDYSAKEGFTSFVAIREVAVLGKTILGSTFTKDPNLSSWLKADNIVVGNSPEYSYLSGTNKDITSLLNSIYSDPKVSVCLYNWVTGNYYLKTGFNLNNNADVSGKLGFTTFIAQRGNNVVSPSINPSAKSPSSKKYVYWDGSRFQGPDGIFYAVGPNSNYLGQPGCPESQQEEIFTICQKMKATSIRSHTLGFSIGSAFSLMDKPQDWLSIDKCFALAKKYNIKLICPLIDNYSGYGAGDFKDYCKAVGVDKTQFYTNQNARNKFKEYIRYWLNHVNPYTGEAIKDSPELLMVELGNELGNLRDGKEIDSTTIPTYERMNDIANYIRSIDQNHMILCPTDESLGKSNEFEIQNFDCFQAHFYYNGRDRINYGCHNSHTKGKPYIIGEYDSKANWEFYKICDEARIDGIYFWALYPHMNGLNGGGKRDWSDGFTLHYPEDKDKLLPITNQFRKMQGFTSVDNF
jgi:mannan endo-1,4-beta-mannosidase